MNYDQAVHYLFTLGRELASPQQASATKFELTNIKVLAERLGNPERTYPTVHIAGTNGKGSTAAMLASILGTSGLRTGLYTSPHLVRINERMRIVHAGAVSEISDDDFAEAFTRLHNVIEELLANGGLAAHPTFFECVTAVAFSYFADQHVDIAVFEVGLGGRLDSTNIITPQVAVITQIDFDHENFLGHSIEEIAGEKAGIIKPGAWVVSAAANPAADAVIRTRAVAQGARLVEVSSTWNVSDLRAEGGCYRFIATPTAASGDGVNAEHANNGRAIGNRAINDRAIEVALPLAGRFQVRNALTAITAARLLAERGFQIDDAAIAAGLAAVQWPGRLERLSERPDVYLDGTHNTAGARELLAFWDDQLAGRRIHLVYGAMRDKAVDEVAGLLFPRATTVILTQSPQSRSISAHTLAEITGDLARQLEVIPSPSAAFERALELAAPEDAVFVAGSLYLVGDVSRYWVARDTQVNEPAPKAAEHTHSK